MVDAVYENPDINVTVFATMQTQESLGWVLDDVGEMLDINTLVISSNDISPSIPNFLDPDFDPSAAYTSNEKLRDMLSTAIAATDVPEEIKEQYLFAIDRHNQSLPLEDNTVREAMDSYITTLETYALNDAASANSLDMDADGQQDLAIIVTPKLDQDPSYYISAFSQIPEKFIGDLPGDSEDYEAAIMFHEAGHVIQDKVIDNHIYATNPLAFEADADATMVRKFNEAAHDHGSVDPAVMEVFQEARLAGGLANSGLIMGQDLANTLLEAGHNYSFASHNTGQLVDWENGLPTMSENHDIAEIEAQTTFQVNFALGLYDKAKMIETLAGNHEQSPEQMAAISDIMKKAMDDMPGTAKNGAIYGHEHPGAALATLEVMSERGYLSNNEEYVARIRRFYEDHAPEILETDTYLDTKADFEDSLQHIDDLEAPAIALEPEVALEHDNQDPIISHQPFTNG